MAKSTDRAVRQPSADSGASERGAGHQGRQMDSSNWAALFPYIDIPKESSASPARLNKASPSHAGGQVATTTRDSNLDTTIRTR